MSHDIAKINGKDAFVFVGSRKAIWHSLGKSVASAMTAEECMEHSQTAFTAVMNQNYCRNAAGEVVPTSTFSIYRSDNNAEIGSGVKAGYNVVQPKDAFKFCDTLVESLGGAHYDTAGCLGKGERIFLSIRVPSLDFEVVEGDKLESSLIFTTTYDGSGASTTCLSKTRPVCQNTLRAALANNSSSLAIRHTKQQNARFDAAKNLFSGIAQNSKTLGDKLRMLAERRITKESMTSILDRLFPVPESKSEAATTRRENVLADVLSLYESNDHNAFPVIKGSAYNLLNAVTEYTDHFRGAKLSSNRVDAGYDVERARQENAAIGSGDALKQTALQVILEATGNAPLMQSRSYFTSGDGPSSGSILDSVINAT
jgi:phage/plasmid-like protein (TIGR03299 family)